MLTMDTTSAIQPHNRILLSSLRASVPQAVDALLACATLRQLQPGEVLFQDTDAFCQRVFLLRQGHLEIHHHHTTLTVQTHEFLGIDSYLDDTPHRGTAIAVDSCQIAVINTTDLQRLEQQYPDLSATLHQLLSAPLHERQRQTPVTGVWSLTARTVMQSPLTSCDASVPVHQAFALMHKRHIGSLGVTTLGQLQGLITYASLAEGLVTRLADPDDPVSRVAKPPIRVNADTPLWKVQQLQQQQRAKYLVVMEQQRPVGVISQTDILETLASYQRSVIAQVGVAGSYAELRDVQTQIGNMARELREHNRSASQAVRALSEIHLAIQRRCVELVLAERSPAPMAYALIIMGSGGRKEMMLHTDQDNGIILAQEPSDTATRQWFVDFSEQVNQRLDQVGYAWCPGNIMARNPDFHRSLAAWCAHLDHITEIPTEKMARWSTVFCDFATLYGDDSLCLSLRQHLLTALAKKPRLLRMMVEDDASGSPALGLFNRLVTANDGERRGKIDLKRNGTRILADAARIYALSEGLEATNTEERIQALMRQGRLEAGLAEAVLAAQDALLDLTLHHQIRQLEDGKTSLDKLLDPGSLTLLEEESLRAAMRVLKRLQGRMQGEFGTVML